MRRFAFSLALLGTSAAAFAGPYSAGGIASTDSRITAYATAVTNLTRGPQNIANPTGPLASFGAAESAVGSNLDTFDVVSLGDGGSITLSFASGIRNGAGADFAVFENAFVVSGSTNVFAELGYVEVSSNGTNFFRFDSASLTPTATQVGTFGGIDATDVNNLAGKNATGVGTPFDLAELAGLSPLLDVSNVRFVRVVDVVGSINPAYARYDSSNRIINDAYATAFSSGGFDLDAIGVLNVVPEPASLALLALAAPLVRRRRR